MTLARIALGLAVVGVAAGVSGCGGGSGGRSSIVHDVKFDVGGRVLYALDTTRPLPGVTITLTDVDGDTKTATSAENGLWSESNLHPGPWIERFELAGYEPVERTFVLGVGGENDVTNVFEGRPDALLEETLLRATVAPFNVIAAAGDSLRDGFGATIQYSVAANGDIVITFDRALVDADAVLVDNETFQNVGASFDPVAGTLTFDAADIDTMNGGNTEITTDADPWTWHYIGIDAMALTPINAEIESFGATIYFNAIP